MGDAIRCCWALVGVLALSAGCDTILGFPDPFAQRDAGTGADAAGGDGGDVRDGGGGGATTIARVAAGGEHTCVVTTDGGVKCWGHGASGRLGLGNTLTIGDDEPPRDVGLVDVGGAVASIAVGAAHACALRTDGTVVCWGAGGAGRLGYGNASDVGDGEAPATAGAVPLGAPAAQVVAGAAHTCARLMTGAVRCWGAGGDGQLGYGNVNDIGDGELPSAAGDVPVGTQVAQLAAGAQHTCALTGDGKVLCWGAGGDGRLGYGNLTTIGDNEAPSVAGSVDVGGPAQAIAAGRAHTCALLATGEVTCWGAAGAGQLGRGTTSPVGDNEAPNAVGLPGNGIVGAQAIAAGGDHACALVDTTVRCWGLGGNGQLGIGGTSPIGDDEPASSGPVVDVGGPVAEITTGTTHTCARLTTGAVRCWGLGALGRLGYGNVETIGDMELPSSAGDVPAF